MRRISVGWLRNVADVVFRGWREERRYRRKHPCATATLFKERARKAGHRGRPVLQRIFKRQQEKFEELCRDMGGCDPK